MSCRWCARREYRFGNRWFIQGALHPRRGRRVADVSTVADAGGARKNLDRTGRHLAEGQRPDRTAFYARAVSRSGVSAIWKGLRRGRPFDRITWCEANGSQRGGPALLGDERWADKRGRVG